MARYRVAVTGGIASGKTAVTRSFGGLGVDVVDADLAAREAVAPGSPGLAALCTVFGPSILAADGGLDRRRMRERVFDNPDARRQLENIIHPLVREALQRDSAAAGGAYAVVAIPLLAEGGGRDAYPWIDRIVVVDVPVDMQLRRLVQRDGIDEALALRMIGSQARREERLAIADDVLVNTGSIDGLRDAVGAIDRRYRRLAAAAMVAA